MPALAIPFLLYTNFMTNHEITHIHLVLKKPDYLVTASETGGVIVWKIVSQSNTLVPKFFLQPSLDNHVGPLTCMTSLYLPIQYFTDKIEHALITIHQDNRIRMWDLGDGQCFNISPNSLFSEETSIINVETLRENDENRFLLCLAHSGNLYLIDIWKMKVITKLNPKILPNIRLFFVERSLKEVYMIGKENEIVITSVAGYFKEEINNYKEYITNLDDSGPLLKKITQLNKLSVHLPGISEETIQGICFDNSSELIMLVFTSKIQLYSRTELHDNKISSYMILSFNNERSLKNIYCSQIFNQKIYILITTSSGNLIALEYEDILSIWKIQKETKGKIDFTYNNFKLFKDKDSSCAFLNISGHHLLYVEKSSTHENLSTNGLKYSSFTLFDPTSKNLIAYLPNSKTLNLYNTKTEIQRLEFKIKLNNIQAALQSRIKQGKSPQLQPEPVEPLKASKKGSSLFSPFISYWINKSTKFVFDEILEKFDSGFIERFNVNKLRDIFNSTEYITISLCAYLWNKVPVYIFGTNEGRVYIFPMYFSPDSSDFYYNFVELQKKITNLYYHSHLLFITTVNKKLTVISFENSFNPFFYYESRSKIRAMSSVNNDSTRHVSRITTIFGLSLQKYIVLQTFLENSIYRIYPVKLWQPCLDDHDLVKQLRASYKQMGKYLVLELSNYTLLLFSQAKLTVEHSLKGFETKVQGVYINPFMEYFLVPLENRKTYVYSLATGCFERIYESTEFTSLFSIEHLINDFSYKDPHDYSRFKTNSQAHTIVEYNMRHEDVRIKYFYTKREKKDVLCHIVNERLGNMETLSEDKMGDLLHHLNYSLDNVMEGRSVCHGMSLLQMNLEVGVEEKAQIKKAHIIFFDCLENYLHFNANSERFHISYLPLISIFEKDSYLHTNMIKSLDSLVLPVFKFNIGIQGIGESFSFLIDNEERWNTSQYLTTIQALANRLYASSSKMAEYNITSKIFNEALDNVFNSQRFNQLPTLKFPVRTSSASYSSNSPVLQGLSASKSVLMTEQKMNLSVIARYFLDSSEAMMIAACELMTVAADYKKIDFVFIVQNPLDLLRLSLQYIQLTNFSYLSKCEVIWLLMIGYSSLNYENGMQLSRMCLNRISKVLDVKQCAINGNYVGASLKLFLDALPKWVTYINNFDEIIKNLVSMYFHYYARDQHCDKCVERDPYSSVGKKQSKQVSSKEECYFCIIDKQPTELKKKLKNILVRSIIEIGLRFMKLFLNFLKKEVSHSHNPDYVICIVDIIKCMLSNQYKKEVIHPSVMHFLVDIVLRTIDPGSQIMRNACMRISGETLSNFQSLSNIVSFHQPTQKYAIGTDEPQIFVYDLRTASKWKTLEGHEAPSTTLAFNNSGRLLASFSNRDATLRVWKIEAGSFFSNIMNNHSKVRDLKNFKIDRVLYKNVSEESEFKIIWSADDFKITLRLGNENSIMLAVNYGGEETHK